MSKVKKAADTVKSYLEGLLGAGAVGGAALGSEDASAEPMSALSSLAQQNETNEMVQRNLEAAAKAADFHRRRKAKESFWGEQRNNLRSVMASMVQSNPLMTSAVGMASRLPWEQLDMPTQGIYGLAAGANQLIQGEGPQSALAEAARIAEQPIDETAQEFGDYVFDNTGSPAAATAALTGANIFGPI